MEARAGTHHEEGRPRAARAVIERIFRTAAALIVSMALSFAAAARTVDDDNGDAVEVPDRIERVVVTNIFPFASAVAVYTGRGDIIKGMHPSSWAAAKSGILGEVFPDILKADHSFMQGAALNIEALMALSPDIVFVNAADRRMIGMLRDAGLTAFAVSTTKWDYDPMATHQAWMNTLAELFPEADPDGRRQDALEAEIERIRSLIAQRTAKSDAKLSALFIVRMDERQIVTSGQRFFGDWWIRDAGGVNAAHDVTSENANAVVSMEQIYAWNPDVVFITNFTPVQPEDLMQDRLPGQDWSAVEAVMQGRVYKMPLGFYRTFTPSAETPFTLLWIAAHLHPQAFADIDLREEARRFYRSVFGLALTDRQIAGILHPDADAGLGAGVNLRGR